MIGKLFGLLAHAELSDILLGSIVFILMWLLLISTIWLTILVVEEIKGMVN